jgi:NTP pyrophosphatase (non-canonical NTP hydrolase)
MTNDFSFICAVVEEVNRAMRKHAPMYSAHEAYAVILEEVDELWDEVRKKTHDPSAMRAELVQIAAMCCRAANDLALETAL